MVTDSRGNIYQYGSKFVLYYNNYMHENLATDTDGSFLNKYSPSGQLLSTIKWPMSFWIQEMINDGNGSFYFTGSFMGTHTINGIAFSSKGDVDGMVGKMNEDGTLNWIASFGGSKADMSNSLTFNASKTKLILTGGISDSLFVNGTFVHSQPQRSTLVAKFDISGAFLGDKLFDFYSTKNYSNFGYRIRSDKNDNYFLLGDREGKNYEDDTIMAPVAGDYLFKLDNGLDITWSQLMISNECYYGYKSGLLNVTESGQAYVPTFCSQKYGGQGTLNRLDENGTKTWSHSNKDGSYQDAYTEGNDLFIIGTEGASICPCPDNNFGYAVIKQIDIYTKVLSEIRISDVTLTHITRSNSGITIVTGEFLGESVNIGNHTVYGSNNNGLFGGTFLLALSKEELTTVLNEEKANIFNTGIFPNPSSGVVNVTVESAHTLGTVSLKVINLLGQVVYAKSIQVEDNSLKTTVDLSDKFKGIYLVEITADNLKEVKRIVLN